jgi:hypothetical protein
MEDVLLKDDDEEISMSALTLKTPLALRKNDQMKLPVPGLHSHAEAATEQNRIPLTVRTRHKVLRMAPPIDDGFRPFRVF